MDSTVVGGEQGVKKRGRPKMYVTDEQIAEQREKRLKYMREYNMKRRHPNDIIVKSDDDCSDDDKHVTCMNESDSSDDGNVTFTGDVEYDDYYYYVNKVKLVTVNVSAYNDDL